MNGMLSDKREIRKRVYMVFCPNCGKMLYRVWGEGEIAFQCERCKTGFVAAFTDGQLNLRDEVTDESFGRSKMRPATRASKA